MNSLLVQLGLRFPDSADEEEFRYDYVVRLRPQVQIVLVLGGICYYVFFVADRVINLEQSEITHGIRAAFTFLCWLSALMLFSERTHRYLEGIQTSLITLASILMALFYAILGSGDEYITLAILFIILFNLALLRVRFLYVVSFSLITLIAYTVTQIAVAQNTLQLFVINYLHIVAAIILGLFAFWTRETDARNQFILKRQLRDSRLQVEELIHSMLPRQIVERMRAGETTIADSYGEVSIVFADLVKFTQLTRQLAPNHLVEILNKLFSKFDELALAHRVEKIKTIGDAYMAVGGMEKGDSLHAERAVEFAFGMLRSVQDLSREIGIDLNVRVGLHVGPIIAGVIGTRKPAFDCWGDSVNMASRLESSAVSGGIQISETARWRLQHKYRVVENAEVDIKGVGMTKTYAIYPDALSA